MLDDDDAIEFIIKELKRGWTIHSIPAFDDPTLPALLPWRKLLIELCASELLKGVSL